MLLGLTGTLKAAGTQLGSATYDLDQEGGLQGHELMEGVKVAVDLRESREEQMSVREA